MPIDQATALRHWALHLAQNSAELTITTTLRIVDVEEGLQFDSGVQLTQTQLERLAKQQLKTPLIDSIQLAAPLSAQQLRNDLLRLQTNHHDFAQLVNATFSDTDLQQFAALASKLPRLLEWLSLLRLAYPAVYQQALFTSIISSVLSHHLGQNKPFQQGAFVAGLCHDLGQLCLASETVEHRRAPEQRLLYQQHPLLAEHFLTRIDKLPAIIARGVAESHERCDGSGYPHHKSGPQLSQLGQILALSDLLWELATVRLWPQEMNLAHAQHILHVAADAHFRNTYEAFVKALKQAELTAQTTTPPEQIPALIKHSLTSVDQLNQCYMSLYAMVTALPREHPSPLMAACYHALSAIHLSVNSAGVLTSEHYEWLRELQTTDVSGAVARELESAALFHVALRWELTRLLDSIKYIYHSERNLLKADVVNLLSIGLQGIKDFQQDRLDNHVGLLLW